MSSRRFERACATQVAAYDAIREFGLAELIQGVDSPARVRELTRVFNVSLDCAKADTVAPRVTTVHCEVTWTDDLSRDCRYSIGVKCGRDEFTIDFTAYRDYDGNLGAYVGVRL